MVSHFKQLDNMKKPETKILKLEYDYNDVSQLIMDLVYVETGSTNVKYIFDDTIGNEKDYLFSVWYDEPILVEDRLTYKTIQIDNVIETDDMIIIQYKNYDEEYLRGILTD